MPASKKSPASAVLVSIKELHAEWGVSERFIEKLIAAGKLPAYKLGTRMVRVKRADADALLHRIASIADA